MIVGMGTDLVDVRQVARELSRQPWMPNDGIFTAAELSYCTLGNHPERRFAACFAAKEAMLKALGTGVTDLGSFQEAEVRLQGGAQQEIALKGQLQQIAYRRGARHINLAIAVGKKCVGAMVVLEH